MFVIVALYVCKFIPSSANYFTNGQWALPDSNIEDMLKAILGIGGTPIVYALWFIHDLFILVMLSPLAWIIIKKVPVIILLLGILWFVGIKIEIPIFDCYSQIISPLFFLIGGFLAVKKIRYNKLLNNGWLVIVLFLLMALIDEYYQTFNMAKNILYTIYHQCVIILGIISVWDSILLFPDYIQRFIMKLSAYSFFIYAAHEPMLTICRKLLYRLYSPKHDIVVIFYYLLSPFLAICFCLVWGHFLKIYFSKLYNIITGDRS
jgi:hypothetical protein